MKRLRPGVSFGGFVILIVLGGATFVRAQTDGAQTSCHRITEAGVIDLYNRWSEALQTKQIAAVMAKYADDATFFPTFQNGPLVGSDAIGKYFTGLIKQSVQAKVESRSIRIGCDMAFDDGLYTLSVDGDRPGSRKETKARYTFVYTPVQGKWRIVHQHSSAVPVKSP
jgi:uncharacterized protein (TIGR02246 family)